MENMDKKKYLEVAKRAGLIGVYKAEKEMARTLYLDDSIHQGIGLLDKITLDAVIESIGELEYSEDDYDMLIKDTRILIRREMDKLYNIAYEKELGVYVYYDGPAGFYNLKKDFHKFYSDERDFKLDIINKRSVR